MQDCLSCLSLVNAKCVQSEKQFSVKTGNVDELLLHLDTRIEEIFTVLTSKIDPKTVSTQKEFITDYIQELINKVASLEKGAPAQTIKFTIPGELTGGKEKSLLQIITLLVKEVEGLKKANNTLTSSLYIPNV